MAADPIRIAVDISCGMEFPMTGVGYRAMYIMEALMRTQPDCLPAFFATRARHAPPLRERFAPYHPRFIALPYARRLKHALWTRYDWPPIEYFCGPADVADGQFHVTPATRRARPLVTIHDLSFILHPHTHTQETISAQTHLLEYSTRKADACVAVSQSCKDDIVSVLKLPPERIFVVPGGVNIEEFIGPFDESRLQELTVSLDLRGPYFVHLGTVEPRKNLPRLIEAYSRVCARRADVPRLLLIGKRGWLSESTFQAIADHGVADRVIHAGYIAREDAVLLLRGAVACVYPSIYEGFGLPVLEAMAAKTPVISSNAASLPEVLGPHGLLVDPLNVDSIEAALEQLLDAPDDARVRAEKAFDRASMMTWEHSAAILAGVYRTVAAWGR